MILLFYEKNLSQTINPVPMGHSTDPGSGLHGFFLPRQVAGVIHVDPPRVDPLFEIFHGTLPPFLTQKTAKNFQ
jgi:hypothetical protein